MVKRPFENRDQPARVWPVLDGISRRAWERLPSDDPRRVALAGAAGTFLRELHNSCRDLPQEDRSAISEPPRGINVDEDNWTYFSHDELIDMIGRPDVCSIAEAYLKTTSLLRALHGTTSISHRRFLFRGQRDIGWALLPRKGRALLNSGWAPPAQPLSNRNLTRCTDEELQSLMDFQALWVTLDAVEQEDRVQELPADHPEWCFRMQHYDTGDGTRMLDLATSLNAALLFACVNWSTGTIDDDTDGIVYLWAEGQNGNVDDFLIRHLPANAEGLFTDYPDAPCFILNPPHNERSKAQSGAFLWWPRFWEEPPYGAPYYLRVPASAKREIVSDLLSLGFGPKEAVRGIKGLENERTLRAQLGLPSWNPLPLQQQ